MLRNIFYNSKTAKIDSNITNTREMYGYIEVSVHCFLFIFFRSIIRINIRIGENKKTDFQFYFFFSLPNNNVGRSVNQSIINKRPK